jgi:hypothetical protein
MIEATAVDGPMASGGAKMVDALSLVYMASMYPPAIGSAQVHMHEIAKLLTTAAHTVRIGFAPPSRRAAYEHGRPGTQPELQRHSVYQHGFDPATKLRILRWRWSTMG